MACDSTEILKALLAFIPSINVNSRDEVSIILLFCVMKERDYNSEEFFVRLNRIPSCATLRSNTKKRLIR